MRNMLITLLIFLFTTGFANTQFNFGAGNENLGNKVKLVQGTREYECDIHVDGCTPSQATCYTRYLHMLLEMFELTVRP